MFDMLLIFDLGAVEVKVADFWRLRPPAIARQIIP